MLFLTMPHWLDWIGFTDTLGEFFDAQEIPQQQGWRLGDIPLEVFISLGDKLINPMEVEVYRAPLFPDSRIWRWDDKTPPRNSTGGCPRKLGSKVRIRGL